MNYFFPVLLGKAVPGSDDTASLLVRITWPGGRNALPRVRPLYTCLKERC